MQNRPGCASAGQMCHCGRAFIDRDEDEPPSSPRTRVGSGTGTCEPKGLSCAKLAALGVGRFLETGLKEEAVTYGPLLTGLELGESQCL